MTTERTIIRAGQLLDSAAGELLQDQAIVIEGEKIAAVMPTADAPTEGPREIDLSGYTVTPGLIDCHAHIAGPDEGVSSVQDIQLSEADYMAICEANAIATVMAGFTTVRDVGEFRGFADLGVRDAIIRGEFLGPRMQCASAYITCPHGGGTLSEVPDGFEIPARYTVGVVENVEDVRFKVNEILDGGADFIKCIATGAVLIVGTDPTADELSYEQLAAAVEETAKRGTFVAAHAHAPSGMINAARAGARSVEHGSLMNDEAIAALVEHGTYLVADIYCGDWIAEEGTRAGWPAETLQKNEDTTDAQREGFTKAVKAGVRMAFGTDSGVYPHGDNGKQLAYAVRYGLSPVAALQSATRWAAEMMGWEDKVGAVEPGLYADLVAIEGHDLGDLSAFADVPFVMKGGQVAKSAAT